MVFKFSFSQDTPSPNVFPPEIFNLFIFIICIIFFIWSIRLCTGFVSMAQLVYALRSGRFNILNIANFDRIDNLWGEGSVRSFIQALFRGNVSSPSLAMKRINTTLNIDKNSLKIDVRNRPTSSSLSRTSQNSNNSNSNSQNHIEKAYGITFKFDSLVPCSVQCFWGVREQAFNRLLLQPFQKMFLSQLTLNEQGEVVVLPKSSSLHDGDDHHHREPEQNIRMNNEEEANEEIFNHDDEEEYDDDDDDDEEFDDGRTSLLASNQKQSSSHRRHHHHHRHTSVNSASSSSRNQRNRRSNTSGTTQSRGRKSSQKSNEHVSSSFIDLNQLLQSEDYHAKSGPKLFNQPLLDNMFVMSLNELIPESQIDQYFTSLPINRRINNNNNNTPSSSNNNSGSNSNSNNNNNDEEAESPSTPTPLNDSSYEPYGSSSTNTTATTTAATTTTTMVGDTVIQINHNQPTTTTTSSSSSQRNNQSGGSGGAVDENVTIMIDDQNEENGDGRVSLPLIIVLRANGKYGSSVALRRGRSTTNTSTATRNDDNGNDDDGPYDEESVCIYCIAHFVKNTASNGGQSNEATATAAAINYSIKVYKTLVQTECGLYEIQDIYGTSDEGTSDADQKCIICWENEREVTLLPCRHMCVCQECFQQIDKCPICRQNTTSYIIMGHPEYAAAQSTTNTTETAHHDQPRVERLVG